jgi:hypothetical protein
MLNQWHFMHVEFSHTINYNNSMIVSIQSARVSRFSVRPTSKRWFLKIFEVTMIHLMPCRNSCRLYIRLAFTCSIGPSSEVWSELGPPFPPMRETSEVWWSRALSPVFEVTLILFDHVWEPTWMKIHWTRIWLRARSHMTSHYTWGSVTTLHGFGGCIETSFGHYLLGFHNVMVTAIGSCVT